jgi:hypothetical protein
MLVDIPINRSDSLSHDAEVRSAWMESPTLTAVLLGIVRTARACDHGDRLSPV